MGSAMKKAIQLTAYDCLDYCFMQKVKQAGFDGVDFTFYSGFFGEKDLDRTLEQVGINLERAGLSCPQVHLPCYDIFASSELYLEEIESRIHYALAAMARLGAKWGAFHPLSATNFAYDRKRALYDNVEKIKGYLDTAEKYGVGIAVENIPVFPDCPQHSFYTSKSEDLCELIDRLDHPLVGGCWDIGHAHLNVAERDEIGAIHRLGSRIKILHVHNNYTNMDWHLCPAFGTVEWKKIRCALRDIGYQGYFSLEATIGRKNKEIKNAVVEFCGQVADTILTSA